MSPETEISDKIYGQYNDYVFKSILLRRANGLLKFAKIPFKIDKMLISEYTNLGPSISRMDFVGIGKKDGKETSLIVECQTNLPTEDDIKRFFQYISSLRIFKDAYVELYILCLEKTEYSKKDFVIKEDCVYTMHMISLKSFKAEDIFNTIENKLKNNEMINDEDIASLQLIVYTDFEQSQLDILNRARDLLERISQHLVFDINEKLAIIYLFDVLSANLLDSDEHEKYVERNNMLINPTERYFKKQGKLEVAKNLIKVGYPIEKIVAVTGLTEEDILNAK